MNLKLEKHVVRNNLIVTTGLAFSFAVCPISSVYASGFVKTMERNAIVQQDKVVKGKVLDENGEPMIGVSVKLEGKSKGAITDFDGNFTINGVAASDIISITYMGYKSQSFSVDKLPSVIKMQPDMELLDEVVVIGYGTVKKRDLTGAVTSIKSEDITLNPGSNPMEALQGKVAGLDITRSSGQAGEGVKMQLRGTRSFTASGNPTFIIDGMPGDYATINPNDIESIEVLKDASSTAVYGAAGANGVIIVTTKSGSVGKATVNFNAYGGFNGWSILPEMRYGESYLKTLREANAAVGNWNSPADDARIFGSDEAYQAHLNGDYINWADELLQTGYIQNYSLSVSGGTEKTKGYISFNFSDEVGQYEGDDYKVYSTNIRIDHKINNWLKVGVNTQGSYVHRNKAYAKLERALVAQPIGKVRDENGNLNIVPNIGSKEVNLLLNTQPNTYKDQDQNFKLYLNPYIELNPLKGLSVISRLGATIDYARSNYFQGEGSYQYYWNSGPDAKGVNQNVYAEVTDKRNYNYKWENIITYNFTLKDVHDFTITGVTSWEHTQYDEAYIKQTNIANNKYLWHNMDATSKNTTGSTDYNMSKSFGLVGRINYSYLGRYLFSASVRYDGSSRLAKDNQWDVFPAFSLGWRISDENFMESTRSWLDNLKLRIGYGVTGTASISPYSSVSGVENSNMALGGTMVGTYYLSKNYANKNLGWEKSYNTNIGLDVSFLHDRINLITDFYITNTKDVIWARNLPATMGLYDPSTYYQTNLNLCETKNTGIELTLNTRNIVTKDFEWSSTLTYNYNKEKIVSLIGGDSDHISNGDTGYTLAVGYPVNSFYHYKLDGVWQLGEEEDAAVFGAKPGDLKINVPGMVKEATGKYYKINEVGEKIYYDATNTYTVSGNDYQVLGHNSPDWTLGFQNTFKYRGFDLSIYMYMRWGQMINYTMLGRYDPTGQLNFPEYFNYWTATNPSNDFPAIDANRGITNYVGSAALNYVDGSFFKIKNITLGYTLPNNIMKKLGIGTCRFYTTITNPLVVAKSHLLKDYDPEMNGSLEYPLTKQLVFGVNLSF